MNTNIKTLPLQTLHINKKLDFIKLNSSKEINFENYKAFLNYIKYKEDDKMTIEICDCKEQGIKINYISGDKSLDSICKTLIKRQIKNYNLFNSKRNKILKKLETLNDKIC